MTEFWKWFDATVKAAKETEIGKKMFAAGFTVAHTGGGCLAWEKMIDKQTRLWVCDEGNGLGDKIDETYIVGIHSDGPAEAIGDEVPDLNVAIAWCNEASVALRIARKWVARVGGGFNPDTKGADYIGAFDGGAFLPLFTAAEAERYDADIRALFVAPGDPYQYGAFAMQEAAHAHV